MAAYRPRSATPTTVRPASPPRTAGDRAGLVVADKGPRAYQFHKNTVAALLQYVRVGLKDRSELGPHHLRVRMDENRVLSADRAYDFLDPGALLVAPEETIYQRWWTMADADSFTARAEP